MKSIYGKMLKIWSDMVYFCLLRNIIGNIALSCHVFFQNKFSPFGGLFLSWVFCLFVIVCF